MTGEVWTAALQAALDQLNTVAIPARAQPYYLDAPVVLKSGQSLTAEAQAEIRLLPGTKTFADGSKLACDISDCVFRNLTDIRTVKAYDQPNLELGRGNDFCDPIGTLRNLFFSRLTLNRPGRFQIAANVDGLTITDVLLRFVPTDAFKLAEIGPMSATYKHRPDDPSTWAELFSPDRDVTVRAFRLSGVSTLKTGSSCRSPMPASAS